jgi:hypothetical protein
MVGAGLRHIDDVGAQMQVDPLVLHHLGDQPARLAIEAAEDLCAAVELRHLDPEAVEDAGEFAGDVAAADDQQALGKLFEVEDVVRHHPEMVVGHPRPLGPPAGGDQDVLGGEGRPVREPHGVRIVERRALVEGGHARPLQKLSVDALKAVELGVQVTAEPRPVEGAVRHVPAIGARIGEAFAIARGEDHELLRHAAPDDAGPAHPAFFGQRHLRATCRRHTRRRTPPEPPPMTKRS